MGESHGCPLIVIDATIDAIEQEKRCPQRSTLMLFFKSDIDAMDDDKRLDFEVVKKVVANP